MKAILALTALLVVIQVAEGDMSCWECKQGWESQEHCNTSATTKQCGKNDICVIRVQNTDGTIGVRKECQNENSCLNNQEKNGHGCINGTIGRDGDCYYCCDDYDYCNWDRIVFTSTATGLFGSAIIVFLVTLLTRI